MKGEGCGVEMEGGSSPRFVIACVYSCSWAVVLVCRQSPSFIGSHFHGQSPSFEGSHLHSWVSVFVHGWLFLFRGGLSSFMDNGTVWWWEAIGGW